MQGELVFMYVILSGVAQGDPMAGFMFVLAMEAGFCMFAHEFPCMTFDFDASYYVRELCASLSENHRFWWFS